jgi:hypothetical protein
MGDLSTSEKRSLSPPAVPALGFSSSPGAFLVAHITAAAINLSVVYTIASVIPAIVEAKAWREFVICVAALVLIAGPTGARDLIALARRLPLLRGKGD